MNTTGFFLSLALALPLYAAQPEDACAGTTYDESVCLSKIRKQTDANLNTAYQKAMKSAAHYGEKDIQNLKDAERKWIAYRDAACEAEYNLWGGGSGGPNALIRCLIQITRERTAHLSSGFYRFWQNSN
jgi:uncharacterized protein YecT (DUF1311 family)